MAEARDARLVEADEMVDRLRGMGMDHTAAVVQGVIDGWEERLRINVGLMSRITELERRLASATGLPVEEATDVRGLLQQAQDRVGAAFALHVDALPEERHALMNASSLIDAAQYLIAVRKK